MNILPRYMFQFQRDCYFCLRRPGASEQSDQMSYRTFMSNRGGQITQSRLAWHALHHQMLVARGHVTRRLFENLVRRIAAPPAAIG